jgi:hypothetical protein
MKRRGRSNQDWTPEEDAQLLEDIKSGKPYAVALKYKRTAIRLMSQGFAEIWTRRVRAYVKSEAAKMLKASSLRLVND